MNLTVAYIDLVNQSQSILKPNSRCRSVGSWDACFA